MGIFNKILEYVAKATLPLYRFEDNRLYFRLDNDQYYEYELDDYDIKTRYDPYAMQAYTLRNSELHLEYMKFDSEVHWNGEVVSIYEDLIKERLKIDSLKSLEEKSIRTYTFKTYKANNSFVFHLIHIYTSTSDLVIIDAKGNLYRELLSRLDKSYQYRYNNEEKGEVNFSISLIKENSLRSYFGL